MLCYPNPAWVPKGEESPESGAAKRLLPSDLNICTPPNFPSKRTVLFKGLNARIMRIRSTSRQPDVGRERAGQGRAGQGGFHHPRTKCKKEEKAPRAQV